MLAPHAFGGGGHLEQSNRSKKMHRAAKSLVSGVRGAGDFYFARGRTHAVTALDESVENLRDLGGKYFFHNATVEGTLAAWVHHLAQCTVGKDNATFSVESGDTIGN